MNDSITIKLNSGSGSMLKVGFLFRAFLIFVALVAFCLLGIAFFKESLLGALICFALAAVLFFGLFNVLNATFFSEQLIVTQHDITYIKKNLSNSKKSSFDLKDIQYFGFAEQDYTRNTMDNNSIVDITGLSQQEKELQYVIDEGNIKLVTANGSFKFGKNMPSWDVEEVIEEIEQFTGLKFKNPVPQKFEKKAEADQAFEDTEEPGQEENTEPETEHTFLVKKTYTGDYGSLTIEQKQDIPSSEDRAFLNGKLAASGKYQVGDKQFVLISNGFIYAVRGFSE